MISKELLSVVLDIPLQHIRYNGTTNHYKIFKENLFNWNSGDYGRWSNLEINIYELAHKCKEWAFKYKYMIDSNIAPTFKEVNNGIVGTSLIYNLNNMESKRFQSDTEPETIFKACEYILKELSNK